MGTPLCGIFLKPMKETALILHNIRSMYNVGSIFRTAEAAGISKIYLVGITPTPIDRFGRARKEIQKTALGAEKNVKWEHVSRVNQLLTRLRKERFYIVGIEQTARSIDYRVVRPKRKTAFIFGNEVTGLPALVLKQCDVVAEIPMKGKKESLNVSVATGIILFGILNV
ncbi:MAG: TrmH family RNA methyltransferase [Parcubacteria group bacterium]|nr:TrmH family RNA methyltransferase [Parcubacteria group bacterium]